MASIPAIRLHDERRKKSPPTPSGFGRLYLWFHDLQSQAKVVHHLTRNAFRFQLADGNCVLVDAEWEKLRELAVPVRRILTQLEADDLRVLFRSDGGDLSTADFPNVHSFTQFALVSQSSWLHEMLDDHRLTTVFQPIVSTGDPAAVFGREALMRGLGRNASVLYPGYILDVARACGMLAQVDHAAREATIKALANGAVAERVFINICPGTAHDPVEAVDTTVRLIDAAGIARQRVVFEVTEADHTINLDMLRRILGAYRDAGFGVALDDVGAGYSSLNLVHQLRPDYIKLDMELVRGVDTDRVRRAIVASIQRMCEDLGITLVAEGIETAFEYRTLRDLGVDLLQGYLFARPAVEALPSPAWPEDIAWRATMGRA
jgi:EAL domain-containing protein (putative c-di-GMP-specific phosphodiesterase class I)